MNILNVQMLRVFVFPRLRNLLGRLITADVGYALLGQQSCKQTIAAADVQDELLAQVTQN